MTGIELIAKERQEQIEKHGIAIEQDVNINKFAQLIDAAIMLMQTDRHKMGTPVYWDNSVWEKMINKSEMERLIIAGALIAAEIDRLKALE